MIEETAHRVQIVAHRGGAGLAAENSMTAFRHALELGVDAIEIDVHQSADGEIVVHHDATLERTTQGHGPVNAMHWDALSQIGLKETQDDHLPRLEDVLLLLNGTSCGLSLEIKQDQHHQPYGGIAPRILETIQRLQFTNDLFIHSFYWPELIYFQDAAPQIKLGANVEKDQYETFSTMNDLYQAISDLGFREVNIDHRLYDEAALALAQEQGLRTTLWTVNAPDDLKRWLALPVRSIATDHPDRALAMRELGLHTDRS